MSATPTHEGNRGRSMLMLAARLMLASAFVYSGVDKLARWSAGQQEIAASGLPLVPLLHVITVIIQLGGGISLAVGIQPRLSALALGLLLVPITLLHHPFLAEDRVVVRRRAQSFPFESWPDRRDAGDRSARSHKRVRY
jgi:uncharacterized membrane protein YphA (DoxX/SURF4 family)